MKSHSLLLQTVSAGAHGGKRASDLLLKIAHRT